MRRDRRRNVGRARFKTWCCGAWIAAWTGATLAQGAAPPDVDPYKLPRQARATWSQAEREYAFSHWDRLFDVRTIQRGEQVHALAALTRDAIAARIALFDAIRAAIDGEGRRGAGTQ